MRIDIKPLSVNIAWQGKRFKTPAYKAYEKEALMLLKPMEVSNAELYLKIEFGVSSKLSDIDNPLKPFLDILQKKMLFNDNQIRKLVVNKTLTKKGEEFIKFTIEDYDRDMDKDTWI